MMYTKDKEEEMVPSAEEKEREEEELEEEGEDDAGDEEREDRGEEEQEEVSVPQAADNSEKNMASPVRPREEKQAEGLNLNNEVVKMRKEVKRVRALITRKLTRQIGGLKKKKGTETEIERNQRRAARLLEEIHAMKLLLPDLVTKTALQKNLSFDQECKNPNSTISDRAIARIATHPQFNRKIEDIKAAVKAFKEERMKSGKQGGGEKVQNKAGKVTPQSPDKKEERKSGKHVTVEQKDITDNKEGDAILEDTTDAAVANPEKEPGKATHPADTADGRRKEMPQPKDVSPASIKGSEVKDIVSNRPQSKNAGKRPDRTSTPEVLQKKKDEEESDLELSGDEEREYFDDSTEERFHKQSSQSEESDDDDFFVGKVSKYKKKKKQISVEGEKVGKGHEVNADPADPLQSKLDELESRLKSKGTSLQSIFCSSLSASKPGGGRGACRGRGGDTYRGQGKPKRGTGLNRDFSKQSKFQNQEKEAETNPGSKYSKPRPEGRRPESSEKGFPSAGRGRGRGRGDAFRQRDRRGGGAFSLQEPQQALHPSWEASKKRKEQQGQILAFQGKRIKFDDDD